MPTTRLLPFLLASALLLSILPGCQRTKPPYRVTEDPYAPQQVNIATGRLSDILAFEEPRVSYDESDLMHISLPVRAATRRSQIIQYRTHFFDRTGQEIYTTQWRTETLTSNVWQTLTAVSTSPNAHDFRIDIREAM